MDKLNWLKERQRGIGGSDVGAILGLNNWKSSFQVYLDKTEEITEASIAEEKESAYWGHALEDLIAKEFTNRTGKKVRRENRMLVSKNHGFMVANIDRRVVGENAILECNTTSVYSKTQWEQEEVPPTQLLQYQHYLAVTEAEKCYVAILIGGQKFAWKEIIRDENLINMLIKEEKDFWENHVKKRVPPSLDGSLGAEIYLKAKYPKANSDLEINFEAEYINKISNYFALKETIKEIEEQIRLFENTMKNRLGEAERGTIGNYLVKWKSITSNRIDSKELKGKYPEIYKEVCRETLSRRFEIKEVM
jgi:putative phage-type endonuclease